MNVITPPGVGNTCNMLDLAIMKIDSKSVKNREINFIDS